MRTDDLIDQLATAPRPISSGAVQRRFLGVALAGALAALVLVLTWLHTRADLAEAMTGRMFWMKASYTFLLAVAGFWALERLARPDGAPRRALTFGAAVLTLFMVAGLTQGLFSHPDTRMAMLRGGSWTVCARNILTLALPGLAATLIVLRGMAPTRPVLTGFAAGAFAGGVAATVYGLHCGESTMVFVGVWYTLGVLGTGALGAVVGKWALRW
ncbi:NrsF family protein [soil metagenome]